jgi:hypothetical protein
MPEKFDRRLLEQDLSDSESNLRWFEKQLAQMPSEGHNTERFREMHRQTTRFVKYFRFLLTLTEPFNTEQDLSL